MQPIAAAPKRKKNSAAKIATPATTPQGTEGRKDALPDSHGNHLENTEKTACTGEVFGLATGRAFPGKPAPLRRLLPPKPSKGPPCVACEK